MDTPCCSEFPNVFNDDYNIEDLLPKTKIVENREAVKKVKQFVSSPPLPRLVASPS
jgi:hypothetical protein